MTAGYSGTPLAKKLGYSGPVWGVNVPETVRAVDAIWSGLKLVVRKELRGAKQDA